MASRRTCSITLTEPEWSTLLGILNAHIDGGSWYGNYTQYMARQKRILVKLENAWGEKDGE